MMPSTSLIHLREYNQQTSPYVRKLKQFMNNSYDNNLYALKGDGNMQNFYDRSIVTPWGIKIKNKDLNNFDYNEFYKDLQFDSWKTRSRDSAGLSKSHNNVRNPMHLNINPEVPFSQQVLRQSQSPSQLNYIQDQQQNIDNQLNDQINSQQISQLQSLDQTPQQNYKQYNQSNQRQSTPQRMQNGEYFFGHPIQYLSPIEAQNMDMMYQQSLSPMHRSPDFYKAQMKDNLAKMDQRHLYQKLQHKDYVVQQIHRLAQKSKHNRDSQQHLQQMGKTGQGISYQDYINSMQLTQTDMMQSLLNNQVLHQIQEGIQETIRQELRNAGVNVSGTSSKVLSGRNQIISADKLYKMMVAQLGPILDITNNTEANEQIKKVSQQIAKELQNRTNTRKSMASSMSVAQAAEEQKQDETFTKDKISKLIFAKIFKDNKKLALQRKKSVRLQIPKEETKEENPKKQEPYLNDKMTSKSRSKTKSQPRTHQSLKAVDLKTILQNKVKKMQTQKQQDQGKNDIASIVLSKQFKGMNQTIDTLKTSYVEEETKIKQGEGTSKSQKNLTGDKSLMNLKTTQQLKSESNDKKNIPQQRKSILRRASVNPGVLSNQLSQFANLHPALLKLQQEKQNSLSKNSGQASEIQTPIDAQGVKFSIINSILKNPRIQNLISPNLSVIKQRQSATPANHIDSMPLTENQSTTNINQQAQSSQQKQAIQSQRRVSFKAPVQLQNNLIQKTLTNAIKQKLQNLQNQTEHETLKLPVGFNQDNSQRFPSSPNSKNIGQLASQFLNVQKFKNVLKRSLQSSPVDMTKHENQFNTQQPSHNLNSSLDLSQHEQNQSAQNDGAVVFNTNIRRQNHAQFDMSQQQKLKHILNQSQSSSGLIRNPYLSNIGTPNIGVQNLSSVKQSQRYQVQAHSLHNKSDINHMNQQISSIEGTPNNASRNQHHNLLPPRQFTHHQTQQYKQQQTQLNPYSFQGPQNNNLQPSHYSTAQNIHQDQISYNSSKQHSHSNSKSNSRLNSPHQQRSGLHQHEDNNINLDNMSNQEMVRYKMGQKYLHQLSQKSQKQRNDMSHPLYAGYSRDRHLSSKQL
eukprot:403374014